MPLKRELGPFWSQTLCVDAVDAPLSPESTIETTEIPPSTVPDLLVLLSMAVHFASGPWASQIPHKKNQQTTGAQHPNENVKLVNRRLDWVLKCTSKSMLWHQSLCWPVLPYVMPLGERAMLSSEKKRWNQAEMFSSWFYEHNFFGRCTLLSCVHLNSYRQFIFWFRLVTLPHYLNILSFFHFVQELSSSFFDIWCSGIL